MSKYTTEVRYICEFEAGQTESQGQSHIDTIITTAAPKIFNFNFPMFDENYRLPLEKKILRHYYTREISEETVGLWKLRLEDKLNIIMPYYNQLYNSELLKFNPLYDVDLTRQHFREAAGNEETSGSGSENTVVSGVRSRAENVDTDTTENGTTNDVSSKSSEGTNTNNSQASSSATSISNGKSNTKDDKLHWDLYSDTPQGGINGITADNDSVANNTYLTNARKVTDSDNSDTTNNVATDDRQSSQASDTGTIKNESTDVSNSSKSQSGTIDTNTNEEENTITNGNKTNRSSGSREINNTEEYIEHVVGKQGVQSYSKLLTEFRATFLNIDKMVIDELSDLFFGLWG